MNRRAREIMIVAGEPSADQYGARLVRMLQSRLPSGDSLRFYGTGGDQMAEAGVRVVCHLRELASIGPREAAAHLGKYFSVYRQLVAAAGRNPPAVAVLIDFPEFNLRLARKLKRAGIPVVYYVSPQIWAWRRGRVRLVRRYVDKMAVILPFEEAFYREHGVQAEFVGHPLLEDFACNRDREGFLRTLGLPSARPTVALLPGSRRKEIDYILPTLLQAARRIRSRLEAQFIVSAAHGADCGQVERILSRSLDEGEKGAFRIFRGRARDLLSCSDFAFVKSGTATLEAAIVGTPFLVVYRISAISWFLGRILIRSQLKGLVNLVVGREIVPEFIQADATPAALSRAGLEYLQSPEKRDEMKARLSKVPGLLGARSASESVASIVEGYL
ncbi:MAG: lipid-A-disaccharide synthase [Acidobacteriota bacterium]